MQVVEGEATEVGAAGRDEILLFGWQLQDILAVQLAQPADRAPQPRGGAGQHRALQLA